MFYIVHVHLGKHILGQFSVMASPIDLKFSGGILGIVGFLARGLLEMCLIHFNIKTRKTQSEMLHQFPMFFFSLRNRQKPSHSVVTK